MSSNTNDENATLCSAEMPIVVKMAMKMRSRVPIPATEMGIKVMNAAIARAKAIIQMETLMPMLLARIHPWRKWTA